MARRITKLLDLIKLPKICAHHLSQLSSGPHLAIAPRMPLLNAPPGAGDAKMRKELRQNLRNIHDATGLTSNLVTHDQDKAMELADLVIVLSMDRPGYPHALPKPPFVPEFITA